MLQSHCLAALRAGALAVAPKVGYDAKGYTDRWEDNLMPGLPLDAVAGDLRAGSGQELGGKLRAAHSSAALAINCFSPWRLAPERLDLAGHRGFAHVQFEAKVPTGLGGTPPHLDLLAVGTGVVAVEAKCTEWLVGKPAQFASSYDRLASVLGESPWFTQMQALRKDPRRYEYLDAAQLVKHAFGLSIQFADRAVVLVYLYWEPRNAEEWEPCLRHREEARQLAQAVTGANVKLVPMSYESLWAGWQSAGDSGHLGYLRERYCLGVL